jgi:hypothetical protein
LKLYLVAIKILLIYYTVVVELGKSQLFSPGKIINFQSKMLGFGLIASVIFVSNF